MERAVVQVGLGVFCLRKNEGEWEVLMGYRGKHSHGADEWELPGGKPDLWESPRRGAQRELKEEVDLDVAESDLQFVTWTDDRFPSHGRHFVTLYFWTTDWQGEPKVMEPTKCLMLKWFPLKKLPSNCMNGTKTAAKSFLTVYENSVGQESYERKVPVLRPS